MSIKHRLATLAIGTTVLAGALSGLPAANASDTQPDIVPGARTNNCTSLHSIGSGFTTTDFCLSSGGTIATLRFGGATAPTGELIQAGTVIEGHAVCRNGAPTVYDSTNNQSGWVLISATPGGVLPYKQTFVSTDGKLRLVQTVSAASSSGGIKIKMAVKNISGQKMNNVKVSRYVDIDANGPSSDRVTQRGTKGIAIRDDATGNGAVLSGLSANTVRKAHTFSQLSSSVNACDGPGSAFNTVGDVAARQTTTLGTLKPGQAKNAIFEYKRA